ncbi:MAG: hypothetical protein LIO56_03080 [Lachnospiraceae bacterium]|nr:hypothetical protein [Lachnospiraceae bacterium]
MTQLLKFKELVLDFVSRYEIYVMAAVRFVIGFAAFRLIILNTGYMETLTNYPIAILLALLCCFLPSGVMVFVGAVLILLEFYALSPMICLLTALIFLIMFCAYMRFTVRKGLYAVLTPILSVLGIPYIMPVTSGLRGEPFAVISVICGEFTYFMIRHVSINAAVFAADEESGGTGVITMAVNELLMDQEMYLYLIGFVAAAIVTFCIRKLSVRMSHLIAAAIGIVCQIAIIGGGEIMLGNQEALTRIILGCVVSFLILLIVSFFMHDLNYRKTENVQFEDDEYYYYVKAIPKRLVSSEAETTSENANDNITVTVTSSDVAAAIGAAGISSQQDSKGSDTESGSEKKNRKKHQSTPEEEVLEQQEASAPQLAAQAAEQAAAAEAAERAAAEAVAERAAAAAQAISAAAGQADSTEESVETPEPDSPGKEESDKEPESE